MQELRAESGRREVRHGYGSKKLRPASELLEAGRGNRLVLDQFLVTSVRSATTAAVRTATSTTV